MEGRSLGRPFSMELKESRMKFRVGIYFPLAGMICLILVLYWPGLYGGFFFDDTVNIRELDEIRLHELTFSSLRAAWGSGWAGPLGRPVSMLSFALNYYFSEFSPFYFKLTNVVIHGVNALLAGALLFLFSRASGLAVDHGSTRRWRFLAIGWAGMWAIHPIQITSVLYVVQRMTSLSSLFVLLALVLHVWARQRGRMSFREVTALLTAWLVCLPLALLSKETGILFVGYVLCYELTLGCRAKSRLDGFARGLFLGVCLAGLCIAVYLLVDPSWLPDKYLGRNFSLPERLMTEARIVWSYLAMIVVPALNDFSLYHDDYVVSKHLLSPATTLLSIFGLVVLGVLALLLRTRVPLVALAIAWFLVGHSLESSLWPLELMHEHRNYLPSLALPIFIMALMAWVADKARALRLAVVGGVLAFAGYLGLVTFLRTDMYGDDLRRTQIEAQYHDRSTRAQYEAGALLVNLFHANRVAELPVMARRHLEKVNELDPGFKLALVAMLQLDCLQEGTATEATVAELNRRMRSDMRQVSDRAAINGIPRMVTEKTLCLSRGQVDGLFASALSNPSVAGVYKSRLLSSYALYLWLDQKDYGAALRMFDVAFGEDNGDVVNRLNTVQLYRVMGDRDGVLRTLAYFENRRLSGKDRSDLQKIKRELVQDGVLSEVD